MTSIVVSIEEHLIELGWIKYPNYMSDRIVWIRRFMEAPRCSCNSGQEGILISLTQSILGGFSRWQLELRGEKPDGEWCDLRIYGIGQDKLPHILDDQCRKLINAWTAIRMQEAK